MSSLSELRQKDVVNTANGQRLGRVIDIEFCVASGAVTAIVVPGPFNLLETLKGERSGLVIPWEQILKIGEDVILVCVEVCEP